MDYVSLAIYILLIVMALIMVGVFVFRWLNKRYPDQPLPGEEGWYEYGGEE